MLSTLGINMQNEDGDTPLLASLKHVRSYKFIERLLVVGAKITIANNKKITPLSFAITHSSGIAYVLLEESRDTQFLLENTLNERLHEAVKSCKCLFNFIVTNRGLENKTIIVLISISHPLYSDNIAFRKLSIFLDYLQAAQDINKYELYNIYGILLRDSIHSASALAFKTIWNRAQHEYVARTTPTLLHDFLINCRYENPDFIECLHLMLTCQGATQFAQNYHGKFNKTFYEELFMRFQSRSIKKEDRIQIILLSTHLIKISIRDVLTAYTYFGFDEEVVILVQHLRAEILNTDFYVHKFVRRLESDEKLVTINLGKLNLIARLTYRKLLNILPEEVLDAYNTLRKKKKVLNEVPTLFELCRYASQKYVLQFYNIHDSSQFHKAVENLCLPNVLKSRLCQDPPLGVSCKF